jgi:hypothetical protein
MVRKSVLAILAALALLAGGLWAGSVAAQPNPRSFTFTVAMTGDQEATPTCSPPSMCGDPDATGTAVLQLFPGHKTVCYDLTWADIDGTVHAAHIHIGPAGVPGPIVVGLFINESFSGTDSDSGCVSADSRTIGRIIANPEGYYVNVHSSVYPAGAIRGQLR